MLYNKKTTSVTIRDLYQIKHTKMAWMTQMNDRTHNGNLSPLSRLNVIICYLWYNYEIRTFEFHLYPASMNHFDFINNYFNVCMFTHTYICLEFSMLLVWNVAFSTMALRICLMHHNVNTVLLPHQFPAHKKIIFLIYHTCCQICLLHQNELSIEMFTIIRT